MKTLSKIGCASFLSILSLFNYSQERFGGSEKALNKLKQSTLQICTSGTSEDIEESLKAGFEKYWNICPVEFVDYKQMNKDKAALVLADFEIKSWTHYTFTQMTFTNTIWLNYSCHFDNLTVKGECFGIDKTPEAIKYKIDLAVLNLNAQFKFLENAYAENKTKGINDWEGYKDRLKTTTVLIPKEYLSNGLTKGAFRKIKKSEFVSIEEIHKRLSDGNTKGYSVLNTYRCVAGSFFNVIDLETGDFIYRHDFGGPFAKGMSGKPDKVTDKEVIEILDKMYKP